MKVYLQAHYTTSPPWPPLHEWRGGFDVGFRALLRQVA